MDQGPKTEDTLYRITGDLIIVPCCPRDPKTCFLFNHQAELRTSGWAVHRDTYTVYFGMMGPSVAHYRKTFNAGTDFKHAAAILAAKELGILAVHGEDAKIIEPDFIPQSL